MEMHWLEIFNTIRDEFSDLPDLTAAVGSRQSAVGTAAGMGREATAVSRTAFAFLYPGKRSSAYAQIPAETRM